MSQNEIKSNNKCKIKWNGIAWGKNRMKWDKIEYLLMQQNRMSNVKDSNRIKQLSIQWDKKEQIGITWNRREQNSKKDMGRHKTQKNRASKNQMDGME